VPGTNSWRDPAIGFRGSRWFPFLLLQAYNQAIRMRETPFLPRRHSVRLHEFDYSKPCVCFLTICANRNRLLFGSISGNSVTLNATGRMVETCWLELPKHMAGIKLSEHIVMPNHVHGIVILQSDPIAADRRLGNKRDASGTHKFGALVPSSIQVVVGSFKSAATKRIRERLGEPALKVWQRGFYERIIWNEKAYHAAIHYIRSNPARWEMKNSAPPKPS
jgi:putative transposase